MEPLDLNSGDLAGFEASLADRIRVSAETAAAIAEATDADLRAHTEAVTEILQRFADAVSEALADPRNADAFLRDLDLKIISRDHDWRKVFTRLQAEQGVHAHKSSAIRHYLRYLKSRKSLVEMARVKRESLAATNELRRDDRERIESRELRRLPHGETVAVTLRYRGDLRMSLGRHPFVLRDGYPPVLLDPNGRVHRLTRKPMSIGRHPENDIVLDRDLNQISRAHLTIEWTGADRVLVTDLSTIGTYVERERPPAWPAAQDSPGPESSRSQISVSESQRCQILRNSTPGDEAG